MPGTELGRTDADAGLDAWLETERTRIDAALERIGAAAADALAPSLRDAALYALSTRGKRLRPILCVEAWRTVTGRPDAPRPVYRLACALEIVHTYSLVHDDLPCMDDDDLRRGRPTVHRVHGVETAVLAGAALLPIAVQVVVREARALELPGAATARLVATLCRAAGAEGMVGGQLRDLEAEQRRIPQDELDAIHRAKTGALLVASLRLGAIAAGADAPQLAALTDYGEALGLAFQITDDVLDVAGSTEALGKQAGRDQALQKSSYPALHGLDGARALARARAAEAKAAVAALPAPRLAGIADYVVERER